MGRHKKNQTTASIIETEPTKETEPMEPTTAAEPEETKEPDQGAQNVAARVCDELPGLPKKNFYRVDEVARYLDKSEQTIKLWIAHGHLPGTIRVNGPYSIPREAIIYCFNSNLVKKKDE